MSRRAALLMTSLAGLATSTRAQESMVVSYAWSEVIAGTDTPVPAPNSIVEPGEGGLIRLSILATINGTDAIGQTTTFTPPPPPGSGTVRGIASFIYKLMGDFNAASAAGSWSNRVLTPLLPDGAFTGQVTNNGASLESFGAGQFLTAGQTANATNPILDAFHAVWSPSSYTPRTVNMRARSTSPNPFNQDSAILIQYGSGFVDPADPSTEYALYFPKFIPTAFGTGVNVPIIPSPSTLPILSLLVIPRRRRWHRASAR